MAIRVGIFFVFRDYHRRGRRNRMSMQPQIGPLLAGLLPEDAEVEVVNETWEEIPWQRCYDLVLISAMHSDFDRARQVSHYFRRRGAATVFGGYLAATHPRLCAPWFDAIVTGDPEANVPQLYEDFTKGRLKPLYERRGLEPRSPRGPRIDLLAGRARHPLAIEATRGCPYVCEFCVLTGVGTRHQTREIAEVTREIRLCQELMYGRIAGFQRRIVGFTDNNLAGNPAWFRRFCEALRPLGITWYAAVTFNTICDPATVDLMARSGCRVLFVGLESFNPAMLKNMRKHQNAVHKVKEALARCRAAGILVISGMMVSPLSDGLDYLRRLPDYLADAGLRVPTFLCFESPIPGTPHFNRLANAEEPALLPHARLHDFTGYTLTVRPRHAGVEEFVAAYRDAVARVYAWPNRLRKALADVPRLLLNGGWFPAVVDLADTFTLQNGGQPADGRTWIAGTDPAPPERVPLDAGDLTDERLAAALLEPTAVTDPHGRVVDGWVSREVASIAA
ncbi:MAG TPA: B12-binding domain-containing radical SAM protein [Rhodocyclaceae bacterium]